MNWQKDANDINYIKAIAVIDANKDYNNLSIGSSYTYGVYGQFYDKPLELLGEDGTDGYFSVIDTIESLKEEQDEIEYLEDLENIKKTVGALEKVEAQYIREYPKWGQIQFNTIEFEELCFEKYHANCMNGHRFDGTLQDAKQALIDQFLKTDGLTKSTWEIVNWCSNQLEWKILDTDTLVDIIVEDLHTIFHSDDKYQRIDCNTGEIIILNPKDTDLISKILKETEQDPNTPLEEDDWYMKNNVLYIDYIHYDFSFKKLYENAMILTKDVAKTSIESWKEECEGCSEVVDVNDMSDVMEMWICNTCEGEKISVKYQSNWEEGIVETTAILNLSTGEITDIETAEDDQSEHFEFYIGEEICINDRMYKVKINSDNDFFVHEKDLDIIKTNLSKTKEYHISYIDPNFDKSRLVSINLNSKPTDSEALDLIRKLEDNENIKEVKWVKDDLELAKDKNTAKSNLKKQR